MSRDENYSPFAPWVPPTVQQPGELLFEFVKGHTRVRCELVDRGANGIEARILLNEDDFISQTFAPWRSAAPRAAAIAWAEQERRDIEAGD